MLTRRRVFSPAGSFGHQPRQRHDRVTGNSQYKNEKEMNITSEVKKKGENKYENTLPPPKRCKTKPRPEQTVMLNAYVETHPQFSLATHPLCFCESTKGERDDRITMKDICMVFQWKDDILWISTQSVVFQKLGKEEWNGFNLFCKQCHQKGSPFNARSCQVPQIPQPNCPKYNFLRAEEWSPAQ